jgi:hypothetical protein
MGIADHFVHRVSISNIHERMGKQQGGGAASVRVVCMERWGKSVTSAAFLMLCAIPFVSNAQSDTSATTTEGTVATTTDYVATTTVATTTLIVQPPSPAPTNVGIEARVRALFPNAPIMTDIARCESKFRQYTDAGNPLRGGLGGAMIGVFQIHETVHRTFAKSLGMDIDTLDGNLAYAKYLYDREGTNPWISSFGCWGASVADAASDSSGAALTSTLTLGVISPEVLTLQKILNTVGFTLATEGPGSPGNETTKFGALTRVAVRKFQCAKLNICSGDEYSTGYGLVGVRTRTTLLEASSAAPAAQAPVPSPPAPSQVSDEAAEIARLQALVEELTAQLAALKQQLAVVQRGM